MNRKKIIIIIDIIVVIFLIINFAFLKSNVSTKKMVNKFKYNNYEFALLPGYDYGFDKSEDDESVLILYNPDNSLLSMVSILYENYSIINDSHKFADMLEEYNYDIIDTRIEDFENEKVVEIQYEFNGAGGYFVFMENFDDSIFAIDIHNEENVNVYNNILNTIKILKTATRT